MHFCLSPRRLVCLFYLITLLFSCVLGVHSIDNKPQTCCANPSAGGVPAKRIVSCAYTKKCREAYVFTFSNKKIHCSSVNAKGINATLATLEKKGIQCLGRTKS